MVISHVHKYVFVELPFTGTKSISKALVQQGDGIRILQKHATYNEFYKTASAEEKKYFVFSCIRNPLDVAVSHYFKYKTGRNGKFERIRKERLLTRLTNTYRLTRYDFVTDKDADFSRYFLRFYRLPYDNWSLVSHGYCDFVIRFENLQSDFRRALELIGIKKEILLPVRNKTAGRESNYVQYYNSEAIERAKYIFGPFMKKWGYQFPPEWGPAPISRRTEKEYELVNMIRKPYWLYLKPFTSRWASLSTFPKQTKSEGT
jgi:hypothetical protein